MVDDLNHTPAGAAEWQAPNKEGEHMTQYVDFTDATAQAELADKLKGKEFSDVRRIAGLGIYQVALGLMDVDTLVTEMAKNPDTVWCCIDEHSQAVHKAGTLCPHAGCGAAAGIHDAIVSGNADAATNVAKVVGADVVEGVKNQTVTPDELGVQWAMGMQKKLAEKGVQMAVSPVNVERYSHHGHAIHSATGISVHTNAENQSNFVEGNPEMKPFMYTVLGDSQEALDNAAREAALAAWIAAGGHGLGAELKEFAVIVRDLPVEKQEPFKEVAFEYQKSLKSEVPLKFTFA